jgi:hypothetical protein
MSKYERECRATRYLARKKYDRERKADEAWEIVLLSGAVLFAVMLVTKTGSVLL